MRKLSFLMIFVLLCLSATAQIVSLDTNQDYIPVISQRGDTLVSSISTGNQWYKNDVIIEGATEQIYICKESASYKVVVSYASGCFSSSEKQHVTTALLPVFNNLSVKIYPNPTNGIFNIALDAEVPGMVYFELFSIEGKLILRHQLDCVVKGQIIPFGNSDMVKGIYTLRMHTEYGNLNRLLVVQ